MILDSSALVAIFRDEAEAAPFLLLMRRADRVLLGAPSALETSMVLGSGNADRLRDFLSQQTIEVMPFGEPELATAQAAFARFGKGSGARAQLNFGDCMSYALAKVAGEPLLFKGDDFTHTDIEPAYRP